MIMADEPSTMIEDGRHARDIDEDDVNDGDDGRVRVGHTNEDIDRVFVGIANQLRALRDDDDDDDDDFRRQLRDLSVDGAPDP